MKIFQIRGSSGSGKTTIVRQFVNKYNLAIKEINVKGEPTFISVSEDGKKVALGRYDKKTGGCDLYKNSLHVLSTIMWVMMNLKPDVIVFEGMIYSSFKFAKRVSDFSKKYNYEYMSISLYTEPDVVLGRIYKRNGGKQINEQSVLGKMKSVKTSHSKLIESGCNAKIFETTNINQEEMFSTILEDLIIER